VRFLLILGLVVGAASVFGQVSAEPGGGGERRVLPEAWTGVRHVAYTARGFAVRAGVVKPATAEAVRRDLEVLRPFFDGLITYSAVSGHEHVPEAARALGYRAVVVGVWDPTSEAELESAVRLARTYPGLVVAVAVGNEGLFWRRYDWPTLRRTLARVREALPGVPVTTSEPFAVYLDDTYPGFVEAQDFLLPNLHPTFEPWFRPEAIGQSVDFVVDVVGILVRRFGKEVLVKETGLPSGPADRGYTEERQAAFWRTLAQRLPPAPGRAFAWFEAFDAPWKPAAQALDSGQTAPEEAHWGLFDPDGRPKPVLSGFAETR
jgi:exo-beta-1,3-glucanase (GH17 family)